MEVLRLYFYKREGEFFVSLDGDLPTPFRPPYLIKNYLSRGRNFLNIPEMAQIGYGLFLGVFHSPARRELIEGIMKDPSSDRHLSLAIVSEEMDIHQLPWETISFKADKDFLFRSPRFSLFHSLPRESTPPYPYEEIIPS